MKTLAAIFLGFGLALYAFGQEPDQQNLLIAGKISDINEKVIIHPFVEVLYSNGKTNRVECDPDGSFELTLPYDEMFNLSFHAKRHQPKSLLVSTENIPVEGRESGYEFSGFVVDLEERAQPLPPKRVGIIYYDTEVGTFVSGKQ